MLRTAETPKTLLADMAREIARIRDPKARHWLVTPGRGRSEQVLHLWANHAGIASHSQELDLRTLLDQIAAGARTRFDFDALRLAVARSLVPLAEACKGSGSGELPIPPNTALSPISSGVLSWATLLARAIDDTYQCREPDRAWPEKSFLAPLVELPLVAAALQSHPGLLTDQSFAAAAAQWRAAWTAKGGVPYLWIQLDAGLPSLLLRRLLQTIRFFETHGMADRIRLFAITPSFEYWSDQLIRSRSRRAGPVDHDPDRHPGGLLWALGHCSRDFQSQICDSLLAEGSGDTPLPSPPCSDSLLGHLHHSCRRSSPPERLHALSPSDSSLTVHSAHTRLREMEICRDRILQAREELDDLRDEDILLLLTNPKEQAPCVEAAFNGAPQVRIPFRLSGFGQTIPAPVATAVERLIQTLAGRFTLPDLQSLLEHPLIARRFGFEKDSGDCKAVIEWLRDAGFRWGSDPAHRRAEQNLKEHRWSLSWALQRLGLGGIVPASQRDEPIHQPLLPESVVPLERASGLSLSLLAKLALFLETLQKARPTWKPGQDRPLSEWIHATASLLETCVQAEDSSDTAHINTLKNSILPSLQKIAQSDTRLESGGFTRLLQEKLQHLNDSAARGGGGVRVGDLRQLAGVPARMILVTGLDNDSFPKSEERAAWHPLALHKCEGDPSAREADRHALLLAILSASERLVFSFCGGSDEDQKERPPSTALADVLNAIDSIAQTAHGKPAHTAILHRHPLNGSSPRAFHRDTPPNGAGRNPADYRAARSLTNRETLAPFPGLWSLELPEENAPTLSLDDLRTLFKEPAKLFLKRLGIRPPRETEKASGADLVEFDALEKWGIRDQLLLARLESADEASLLEKWRLSGSIPRGQLGETILKKILEKIPLTDRFTAEERIRQTCRVPLSSAHGAPAAIVLEGTPRPGWYQKPDASGRYFFSASELKITGRAPNLQNSAWKHELAFYVDALTIAAAGTGPGAPSGPTVGRFSAGVLTLPSSPAEHARELLSRLVPLCELARRIPLPFWPESAQAILPVTPGGSLDETVISEALEAGRQKWVDGNFNSQAPPECKAPATRLAFRGLEDPMTWCPEISAPFLPDAGAPLAWRVARFVRAWMDEVGGRISKN